jgi:hypothetical protein
MIKKNLLFILLVLISSLALSACSPTAKLSVDSQIESTDSQPTTSDSRLSASPSPDPSKMSDEQLLLQMESESDASIDQEFSRLEKELE